MTLQQIISIVGLVVNLLATLLIAFSFGKNIGNANQWDEKGRKVYLASFLHPKGFTIGIILLFVSFFLLTLTNFV